uniref:Predicted protein n=1 Tax=Hordeum vulgare subsp. vulgare TaxID=112509 RepID=F2DC10_HORVV|nr:predicted protein [Hordeum vulgare subsp. vulgare]
MLPAPLAAVLLLPLVLALLPAGGRCQQGDGDRALPPSPSAAASEVLMARMHTVGQELADEVQSKYGFCMSSVNDDFNQTFSFNSDPSFISECNEQSQGTNNMQASHRSATFLVVYLGV